MLVLDNLREFKNNNIDNIDKNRKELTLEHCKLFLTEIHTDYIKLLDEGIINRIREAIENEDPNEIRLELKAVLEAATINHHNIITTYLNKIEYFSAYLLHGEANNELAKSVIGKTFVEQMKIMVRFIGHYENLLNPDGDAITESEKDEVYENTKRLYKNWLQDTPGSN